MDKARNPKVVRTWLAGKFRRPASSPTDRIRIPAALADKAVTRPPRALRKAGLP